MKPRLLIIGCGDVLSRALPWLARRFRVYILTRKKAIPEAWRQFSIIPIYGDLDYPATLKRLQGIAQYCLYSVPPGASGSIDSRLHHVLRRLIRPPKSNILAHQHVVYISTSGVYGDCQGEWITETRRLNPENTRAIRRVDAENQWRHFARRQQIGLTILRAPGIYAENRLPIARLEANMPVLCPEDDNFSNHIHAQDLAHIACLALFRASALRIYNACDDQPLKMGNYFTQMAKALNLPLPPRIKRAEAEKTLSPMTWSFMRESRKLCNQRMKKELRIRLQYPSIATFLRHQFII